MTLEKGLGGACVRVYVGRVCVETCDSARATSHQVKNGAKGLSSDQPMETTSFVSFWMLSRSARGEYVILNFMSSNVWCCCESDVRM
jgi:hypothetical protein